MKFINRLWTQIKTRKFKYISFFWIIISIQFVIGSNLQVKGKSIENFTDLLISILKIIFLSIIFILLHYSIENLLRRINIKHKENNKKELKYKWLIYFLIIIICWIPTLLAFYPCIISYDGGYQIRNSYFRKEINGHPIITTFLYTAFYDIGVCQLNSPTIGMFIFSIFQMLVMGTIFSYSVKFIEEATKKKWIRNIAIIFYAIFPYNQLFPLITTKDVLLAGFVLTFIINIYKILKEKYEILDCIYMVIITTLMLLLRSNVIYAVLALIPFIIILIKEKESKKKLVIIILISIILANSFTSIVTNIALKKYTTETGGTGIFICPFTQFSGKIAKEKQNELTKEEKEKLTLYFGDYKKLGEKYVPYIADNTAKMINNEIVNSNKKEFFGFMKQLIKKEPRIFIESYLNTIRGYWYINDTSFSKINNDKKPDTMGTLELFCFPIGKNKFSVVDDSKLPELKKFYQNLFCRNEYQKIPVISIIFQPATYFYMLVAYLLFAIYKRNRVKTIIGLYLLLYFMTCFLAPCAIVRYIYPIIVCTPILIGLVVEKEEKEK